MTGSLLAPLFIATVCAHRRGGFDFFVRQAIEQLSELSEGEMSSTRKQLKTQQMMFALKLETTRSAARPRSASTR